MEEQHEAQVQNNESLLPTALSLANFSRPVEYKKHSSREHKSGLQENKVAA